jgi:flagellar biosynthetic protein FliQ
MTDAQVVAIAVQAMWVCAKVSAPILLVSVAIGFFVSVLQSATQIQEFTLTFVPKLIGLALVIVLGGNWMLNELISFTEQLYNLIPELVRQSG